MTLAQANAVILAALNQKWHLGDAYPDANWEYPVKADLVSLLKDHDKEVEIRESRKRNRAYIAVRYGNWAEQREE